VEKKLVPDTVKEVMAINVKTRRVMKVGTWINIAEVAYKAVKKNALGKIEQKMFEVGYRAEVLEMSGNFHRLFGSCYDTNGTTFFKALENESTIEFFQELRKIQKGETSQALTSAEGTFAKMFQLKAKKHTEPKLTVESIRNTMSEKYMGIFSFTDYYSVEGVKKLANLINFIDKAKAKTS
jgi:hypothetical protein